VPLPEHVDAIDALLTDKLLGCYSSGISLAFQSLS